MFLRKRTAAVEIVENRKDFVLRSRCLRGARQELFDWLKSVRVSDAPESIASYCIQDFERFVQTFGFVQRTTQNAKGPLTGLELGGNSYFTTMLLKEFHVS